MPNTVARPATLGACQVRLQLSMLFEPITDARELLRGEVHLVRALRTAEEAERLGAVLVRRPPAARRRAVERFVPGRRTKRAAAAIAHHRLGQSS